MTDKARLLIADTPTRFGLVSILLHWTNAAFVLAMLYLGILGGLWLHRGAYRSEILDLHVSLGLIAVPFFALRIFLRLKNGRPSEPDQPIVLKTLAALAWKFLLLGIVLQLLVGPFLNLTHRHSLDVFGVTLVPAFLPQMNKLHDVLLKPVHTVVGLSMLAVICLHALGAFKHLLVDRDGVLQRMLWPFEKGRAPAAYDGAGAPSRTPAE